MSKTKNSSPQKDEPGKKRKGEINNLNISLEDGNVKEGLESVMTLLFKSLYEICELRRKAREVRDGS